MFVSQTSVACREKHEVSEVMEIIRLRAFSLFSLELTRTSIKIFSYFDFPCLQYLILSRNEIVEFSHNNLPKLKKLILDHNKLTSFTCDLPNVGWLDVAHNRLVNFNPKLSWGSNLVANGNRIERVDIPVNLDRVWLDDNRLKYVRLVGPRYVFLSNNPDLDELHFASMEQLEMLTVRKTSLYDLEVSPGVIFIDVPVVDGRVKLHPSNEVLGLIDTLPLPIAEEIKTFWF